MTKKNAEQIETNDVTENTMPDEKLSGSLPLKNIYIVDAALVAIRVAPNINAVPIERVVKDMKIEAYADKKIPEPWLRVSAVDGQVAKGYINSTYLSKE